MMAIDESQTNGASLAASCAMLDMGVRTIQRWRKDRDAEDMRMGPKTEPTNKLCKRERSLGARNHEPAGVSRFATKPNCAQAGRFGPIRGI